jgi:hypothetical protein
VISGKVTITAGETVDRRSLKPLPPASVVHLPAGLPHYAHAEALAPRSTQELAIYLSQFRVSVLEDPSSLD